MTLLDLQQQLATALTGGAIPKQWEQLRLHLAADMLIAKRRQEVLDFIPRTMAALGNTFHRQFTQHARSYRPQGLNYPRDDAEAFVRSLITDRSQPKALRDCARFELSLLKTYRPQPLCEVVRVEKSAALPGLTGLHIWWRWRKTSRLRYLYFAWL